MFIDTARIPTPAVITYRFEENALVTLSANVARRAGAAHVTVPTAGSRAVAAPSVRPTDLPVLVFA